MEAPFNIINDIFKASVCGDMREIRQSFSDDAEIVFLGKRYDADGFSQLMADFGNRSYGIDALTVEDEAEDAFHTDFSASVFSTDDKGNAVVRKYRVFLLWRTMEDKCLICQADVNNKE